ncbi:glycosyltransferase family 4 protein [Tellurirhabdus rosea]|uniref:glycosyltransferase family 4 protein n=1 Tax=Tellurirhabdus rosea TaxID=2674997 RepID=UPI00225A860E|nr:glycosyltransferase family 4 protein [Tellurirhabdus rosea]
MKKKILFIGHDANRAGAQLVLLQLLRLLKQRNIPTQLVLGGGGPLEAEFQEVTTVTRMPMAPDNRLARYARHIPGLHRLAGPVLRREEAARWQAFESAVGAPEVELVVVNTVACAVYYRQLARFVNAPVILFAHELALSIRMYSQPDDLRFLLDRSRALIAVSKAVANHYVSVYGYDPARIQLQTLIDRPHFEQLRDEARSLPSIRPNLGIPADAIVVGACGNAEWRKGNDLFTSLARLVVDKLPDYPIHFVWVGVPRTNPWYDDLWMDVEKAGLTDRVHFVEPTPEVFRYTTQFDIFALTSREDPYPLVMLEAALCRVPVVCFDGAGGGPELVEEDGGRVVPYLHLDAMAEAVAELAQNPAQREQAGRRLFEKVAERHPTSQNIEQLVALFQQAQTTQTALS